MPTHKIILAVESSYDGPKIEEDEISKDFIEAMMETFRKQAKIHRKFAFQV